jgi:hypothetical protein
MALHYDFSRCKNLSAEEKKVAYNFIPFILMSCGVQAITEESIPIIIARERLLNISDERLKDEDLKPFIGYNTNVGTLSNKEWVNEKFLRHLPKFNANKFKQMLCKNF